MSYEAFTHLQVTRKWLQQYIHFYLIKQEQNNEQKVLTFMYKTNTHGAAIEVTHCNKAIIFFFKYTKKG